MSTKIDDILEELYLIDPAMRDEEETLKKTIIDLLKSRPDGRMDKAFEAELKEKLLAEFSKKTKSGHKRSSFFLARPAFRIGLGVAAAALVAVYVAFAPGTRGLKPAEAIAYTDRPTAPTARVAQAAAGKKPAKLSNPSALRPIQALEKDKSARLSAPMGAAAPIAQAETEAKEAPMAMPSSSVAVLDKKADDRAEVLADRYNQSLNTEGYDRIVESSFAKVLEEPLSTFSIDVDTASYANVRRFLREGSLPPPDAVRIEELVNYFPYDYAGPTGPDGASGDAPFAFDTELSPCPWNQGHSLLRIALQAKRISDREMPPSNLVFLIDVSGSMDEDNKLPLVKESLKMLARRMRQEDRISIVVYAGSAGIVLEPTAGSKTAKILQAIDDLEAGGSTAGGEGIALAYDTAKKAFIPKGSNRVILATDGDFNVGASSDGELVRLIEEERKAGVFLSVLGFGMGNYKDSKMQKLADSGNGNYAYIDSLSEADKVLGQQMAGTLFTVAKDVKVQIEFNPALVGEYRLIGYEKRALAARDFADDAKDAGELGAGASVTALYELIPPSGASKRGDLKYQSTSLSPQGAAAAELLTLKFRYKKPDGSASSLIEQPLQIAPRELAKCSADFRFAAAVAEWGLILRGSAYKGGASLEQTASLARGSLGRDLGGYRAEFLELVSLSKQLGR
jgi:Ca-activated chloride channel family protein